MTEGLDMYTIYENPSDYPGKFVVRQHVVKRGFSVAALHPLAVVSTLKEARAAIPPGLYNMGREDGDEPQIVETWI